MCPCKRIESLRYKNGERRFLETDTDFFDFFFFLNLMVSLTVQLNGLAHQKFSQSKYYTNGRINNLSYY